MVSVELHGLRELQEVTAGLSKVLLFPFKALGYCGLDRADGRTGRMDGRRTGQL